MKIELMRESASPNPTRIPIPLLIDRPKPLPKCTGSGAGCAGAGGGACCKVLTVQQPLLGGGVPTLGCRLDLLRQVLDAWRPAPGWRRHSDDGAFSIHKATPVGDATMTGVGGMGSGQFHLKLVNIPAHPHVAVFEASGVANRAGVIPTTLAITFADGTKALGSCQFGQSGS